MAKRLNSRGDTLVEVMIAVAILSVILAASYTLSSYAARLGQSAKERTQAVAYAQQQAEILQSYASKDWNTLVDLFDMNEVSHFRSDPDSESWEVERGRTLEYPADEVAANYVVSTRLIADCPEGQICVPSAPIKQLTFEITVDWEPVLPGPTNPEGEAERSTTRLIVKVSPPGDQE